MPKTTKKGQAKKSELPSTLQKSSPKAQRTFAKAHDSAAEEYGEGERAHRVAYSFSIARSSAEYLFCSMLKLIVCQYDMLNGSAVRPTYFLFDLFTSAPFLRVPTF